MDWLSTRFELSRSGSAPNSRPMEGLRGCAVLLVFIVHYTTLAAPWFALPTLLQVLHTIGNSGVDLFFVLSGYLIYGSLISHPQPVLSFLRRRIARIYPAYSAVFALYLLLCAAVPQASKIPPAPLAAARYIAQNYLLLCGLGQPLVTVSWSLSYEMAYYLAMPALIAAFGLRRRPPVWRCGLFALLLLTGAWCHVAHGAPVRLLMFLAGVLLHEAIHSPALADKAPGAPLVGTALALAMTGMLTPLPPLFKFGALFVAYFLLCFNCLRRPAGVVGRCCSVTPLRWLGNMSYSYYLLHGLALKAAFALLPPDASAVLCAALLVPMFLWTLVASAALFLLVERPCSLRPRHAFSRTALLQKSSPVADI
ncbi:MAG: acyltransferase family protein [Sphingomonadaceae bacterium]